MANLVDIRYQRRENRAVSDEPPSYLPASWKGIPFFCEQSTDEFGRRGDLYEYPLSDITAYKDLGRKARRFKIEGYLIGTNQVDLTNQIMAKVEEPEPGYLNHPIYGYQRVACVTLTTMAEYKKDKKRTKLSFEFVEANMTVAPFKITGGQRDVFNAGNAPAEHSGNQPWSPTNEEQDWIVQGQSDMSDSMNWPGWEQWGNSERKLDAQSYLERGSNSGTVSSAPLPLVANIATRLTPTVLAPTSVTTTPTLRSSVAPVNFAASVVRELHSNALTVLRGWNRLIVNRAEQMPFAPAVQAYVATVRLILAREMAIVIIQKSYETVKAALDDLDLIMAIWDEEEQFATQCCDEIAVSLIHQARAQAAATILARNIRLPGIAEFPTDGLWPSLVVAHKLYVDGTRHEQVEKYNPTMQPFWMGRSVVAPAS